ncbi:MAG: hypothetical protein ACJAZS_000794 [Alteromonas naphthalenivorans]|jgi:hypothetical protein
MKKITFFAFLLTSITFSHSNPNRSLLDLYNSSASVGTKKDKATTYLGTFQFPSIIQNPSLRIYYKGRIVEMENGAYSFTENKKFQVFTIIAALLPPPTTNTPASLTIPEGIKYARYSLFKTEATVRDGKKKEEWRVEKTNETNGITVPSDALLVVLDPDLIEDIKIFPWFKESFTLNLPAFIMKKNLSKKAFDAAYNRSILTALDWDVFHQKEQWEEKKHKQNQIARRRIA